MIVGGQNSSSAVCLGGGRALSRFSVCPSNVQEVRASPLGFIVFCESGSIKLFNATCHLVNSFSLRPYSTVAVLSSPDNVTSTVYINRRGNLVRYEFGGGSITLYTRSDIESTFGTCSARWSLRTYNSSHFIFECPSSKRYLVNGFTSNSNKVVLNGSLFINSGADEAVIINGDHSFTFYWNGFSSPCTINVPLSTSLLTGPTNIDFGKNNGQTVIVLFNSYSYNTFVYDTSRGCKDEYLWKLNLTYPCVMGECDGYYIVEDGPYFVAVNNRSSNKLTLDLFNVNDSTAAPHTITNLQELPDVLNVNKSHVTKSQVHASTQVTSSIMDTMISSQAITSTTSTMASSISSSLLITTSSTTSSTLSSSPSPTLSPKTEVPHHLYYGPAIAIAFVGIIIIAGVVVAAICGINHRRQKRKKLQSSGSVSMVHSTSNPSTRSSSAEPSDVMVTDIRQESGETAAPISASRSINSFRGDYKTPITENSDPNPASLV